MSGFICIEEGHLADFANTVFHCQAVKFKKQESSKKLESDKNSLPSFFFSFHFVAIKNNNAVARQHPTFESFFLETSGWIILYVSAKFFKMVKTTYITYWLVF